MAVNEHPDPEWDPSSFRLPELDDQPKPDFRFTYDRAADELDVDFYGEARPAVSVPLDQGDRDYIYLRVDPASRQVVGLQIEAFLAYAVKQHPDFLAALVVADLPGFNDLEATRLRRQAAELVDHWDANAFVAEIGRLIA